MDGDLEGQVISKLEEIKEELAFVIDGFHGQDDVDDAANLVMEAGNVLDESGLGKGESEEITELYSEICDMYDELEERTGFSF